ncbi:MAG: hypothetical protein ACYCXA_12910 [Actinomycetes bacterium]
MSGVTDAPPGLHLEYHVGEAGWATAVIGLAGRQATVRISDNSEALERLVQAADGLGGTPGYLGRSRILYWASGLERYECTLTLLPGRTLHLHLDDVTQPGWLGPGLWPGRPTCTVLVTPRRPVRPARRRCLPARSAGCCGAHEGLVDEGPHAPSAWAIW